MQPSTNDGDSAFQILTSVSPSLPKYKYANLDVTSSSSYMPDGITPDGLSQIHLSVRNNVYDFAVRLKDNALEYIEDYSAYYNEKSLVDKAYVDNKTSNATFQTVLDNGNYAHSTDYNNEINIDLNSGVFLSNTSDSNGNGTIISQNNSQLYFSRSFSHGTDILVYLKEEGLTYSKDYSDRFIDRSLVDKAYVDSKISSPFELSWSPWTNCIVESYQETTFNQLRWRRKGDTIQIDGVAIRQNNNTIGNAFAFMPSQLKPSFDMKFTGWNGRTNSFLMIYFSSDNAGLSINGTASLTDPLSFTIEYTI